MTLPSSSALIVNLLFPDPYSLSLAFLCAFVFPLLYVLTLAFYFFFSSSIRFFTFPVRLTSATLSYHVLMSGLSLLFTFAHLVVFLFALSPLSFGILIFVLGGILFRLFMLIFCFLFRLLPLLLLVYYSCFLFFSFSFTSLLFLFTWFFFFVFFFFVYLASSFLYPFFFRFSYVFLLRHSLFCLL